MSEEHQSSAEKAIKRIKEVGTFSQILGWWKIIAVIILPAIMTDGNELSEFLNYSYFDLALNIVFGIVLIILGSRIKKGIHKGTKKYVWIILILSGIFGSINVAISGGKTSIMLLLFAFSIYALTQFKHIKISDEKPKHKIKGKKWILVIGAFILIVGAGLVLDLNQYGYFIIDNKDAFYIEYTAPYEALDVKVVGHNKQWQIVHDGALFMITAGGPEAEYSALEKYIALSVGSFIFEK